MINFKNDLVGEVSDKDLPMFETVFGKDKISNYKWRTFEEFFNRVQGPTFFLDELEQVLISWNSETMIEKYGQLKQINAREALRKYGIQKMCEATEQNVCLLPKRLDRSLGGKK